MEEHWAIVRADGSVRMVITAPGWVAEGNCQDGEQARSLQSPTVPFGPVAYRDGALVTDEADDGA